MTRGSRLLVLYVLTLIVGFSTGATLPAAWGIFTTNTTSAATVSTATLAAPTSLAAIGTGSVALSWTATTSTWATGTRVFRATAAGGPYSQIDQIAGLATTTYIDNPASGTFYYVAEAYYSGNGANWTSVNSNEVNATCCIQYVQNIATATKSQSGNSSITMTVPASGVAAAHRVIVATYASNFAGAVSCADSRANTYTVDVDNLGSSRLFVCSAHITTALQPGDTITTTYPGFSGVTVASANEFSGITASSPVDQTSSNSGNDVSPNSGTTATTAQAPDLLLGVVIHASTPTFTPDTASGYTMIGQIIGGSGSGQRNLSPEYRIVSSTGSYGAAGTLSSGQTWRASIITYKAA